LRWLSEIEKTAKAIYLLGDIFDFWFEYKKVVPKGYVRLLAKLASLNESGIEIHLVVGNHDLWAKDYLQKEIGIIIHYENTIIIERNTKILIGHGDGLGKGDYFYKFIKILFTSKTCQWLFSIIHPDIAISLADSWSKRSRKKNESPFVSKEKEILFGYCKKQQSINPVDYYIFGHRHIPLKLQVDKKTEYINLGDWVTHNTYAVMKEGKINLETYNR
jgi:UDP-2,3-diacylglucosamine hydrolase